MGFLDSLLRYRLYLLPFLSITFLVWSMCTCCTYIQYVQSLLSLRLCLGHIYSPVHLTFARTKGFCFPFTLHVLGIAGYIRSTCRCPLCDRDPRQLQREAKVGRATRRASDNSPVKPSSTALLYCPLYTIPLLALSAPSRSLSTRQLRSNRSTTACRTLPPPRLSGRTDHYLLWEY